jgi:hypothetical protein
VAAADSEGLTDRHLQCLNQRHHALVMPLDSLVGSALARVCPRQVPVTVGERVLEFTHFTGSMAVEQCSLVCQDHCVVVLNDACVCGEGNAVVANRVRGLPQRLPGDLVFGLPPGIFGKPTGVFGMAEPMFLV